MSQASSDKGLGPKLRNGKGWFQRSAGKSEKYGLWNINVGLHGLYMGYIWVIYGLYMGYIWVIYGLYMGYICVLYQTCWCTVNLPFNSLRRCWSRNWWVSPGCKGRVTLFVTKPWCNHHPGERFIIFHQVSQTRMEGGALVWINPIQLTVLGFIPTKRRREPLREPLSRLDLDIILHCSKMGGIHKNKPSLSCAFI